ncbi:MAG: alpha/beta hydrolase [Candidatus Hydrogenedentota bacterium]
MLKMFLEIIKFLSGFVAIVLPLSLILIIITFNKYTHPPKYPLITKPSDYGIAYEDVRFLTEDGMMLSGWFIKGERDKPGVIVIHGYGTNRSDLIDIIFMFYKLGFSVLSFDFRAHGESGGTRTGLGWTERKDVRSALLYLKNYKMSEYNGMVGAYGTSMGASATILATDKDLIFDFYIIDGAYARLQESIKRHLKLLIKTDNVLIYKFLDYIYKRQNGVSFEDVNPYQSMKYIDKKPVLLIYAEDDSLACVADGLMFQEWYPKAELIVIKGAEHGQSFHLGKDIIQEKILKISEGSGTP